MFSKNAFFSMAICIALCSACTPTDSTSSEMSTEKNLSPEQQNINTQLKKLEKRREHCKARLYVETDEAIRNEFDNDWETYEGHLTKQEFFEDRLKKINAEIKKLEKKKKALQSKPESVKA